MLKEKKYDKKIYFLYSLFYRIMIALETGINFLPSTFYFKLLKQVVSLKKVFILIVILFQLSTQITDGQEFKLQLPVKCDMGNDCWLINYVDNDPTENWQDFSGGKRTYDGHKGTDIAIQNLQKMKKGVDVLAAADGTVITVRDGILDMNSLLNKVLDLEKFACGNRVAIAHQDGWITDYCHLKKGSVMVKKGNIVKAGQKIGTVGLSGLTEFPHLHFCVMKHDNFFDPFTGQHRYLKKKPFSPLWQAVIMDSFQKSLKILLNVGVGSEIPDWTTIKKNQYGSTSFDVQPSMILAWADLVHVKKNDSLEFHILGPDEKLFLDNKIKINKANVKKYLYIGKKRPAGGFMKGFYKGVIKFTRPSSGITDQQPIKFTIH